MGGQFDNSILLFLHCSHKRNNIFSLFGNLHHGKQMENHICLCVDVVVVAETMVMNEKMMSVVLLENDDFNDGFNTKIC